MARKRSAPSGSGVGDDQLGYDEFIAGIELLNLRLARAEVNAPTIYVEQDERELEADLDVSAVYMNFEGGFVVNSSLTFTGTYTDSDDAAVSVTVELEVVYRSVSPMADAVFEVFQLQNLRLNTWPFFREYVQNSLARTGWPGYTLPVFRSSKYRKLVSTAEATVNASSDSAVDGTTE